jgi:hypothetical protein
VEIYIISYCDNDLTTGHEIHTDKLKAINAFHEYVESENEFLIDRGLEGEFKKDIDSEHDHYVATCYTDGFEGKIELVKKTIYQS